MSSTQQKAIVVETVGGGFKFAEIPKPTLIQSHNTPHPIPCPLKPHSTPSLSNPPLLSVPCSPLDVLIKVMAVSLNPVDLKVKNGMKGGPSKGQPFPHPKIVGYDGAGVIQQVGSEAAFKVGDEVWWAGDITREGSFQQFQLVNSRLISLKPHSLTFDQAASLPLCTITAYELMKERMQVKPGHSILITAGAGGVGSIATQLAKHWGLRVISSVSRAETAAWTMERGADLTVDHKKGIVLTFQELGLEPVLYCFNTFSEHLLNDIMPIMAPFGHVGGINSDISDKQIPALALMQSKVLSYHLEFMFAKSMYKINEQSQGDLLGEVAKLVDEGKLVHTMGTKYSWKDVAKAYEFLEGRTVIGKVVMTIDENAPGVGNH